MRPLCRMPRFRVFIALGTLLMASWCLGQDLRPSAYVGVQNKVVTVRGSKLLGVSGGVTTIAGQDITPTANATTYIYINLTGTPTLATSNSAFPASAYFPICTVVTDINGIITSFTDSRPDFFMAGGAGGGLPAGLSFVSPELDISAAGSGSGILGLVGNTSGTATFTAPAVAGTTTNPVVMTNNLQGPAGTVLLPAFTFAGHTNEGIADISGTLAVATSGAVNFYTGTSNTLRFQMSAGGNFAFVQGKGQHLNTQAANNDTAGVCAGTTTTCSVSFTTAYTATPSCVITPTTTGVTSAIITSQATTGFTVTYAPSASTNFNYICIGNPN